VTEGFCKPGFERVAEVFAENFRSKGEVGASVSLTVGGETVVDLWGGIADLKTAAPWTRDTVSIVFSCTKGATALCAHMLASRGQLDLDAPVVELWPEFGQHGKERVTTRMMLDHSAAVPALRAKVKESGPYEWDYMTGLLAAEEPFWPPGTRNGYHGFTFGWTVGEMVRRASGRSLGTFFQEEIARPLGLDFWIGLPENKNSRVATIYAAKPGKFATANPSRGGPPEPKQFYADLVTPGTLACRTFTSPYGLHVISKMNNPAVRAKPIVSFGGIGSASALAKFYSMLANGGALNGHAFLSEETIAWMTTTLADGIDRVFQMPTSFSAGFMKDSRIAARRMFGTSPKAFGHPGAGGSHAFADLENRIAFAYVINQMEQ